MVYGPKHNCYTYMYDIEYCHELLKYFSTNKDKADSL